MSVGVVDKQTGDRIPTAGMPAIDDALDLTSVNPVQNDIITAALANKQDKTDNNLETTAKTIVGAINEHEGDIDSLKSGLTNLDTEVNGDATVYPYADVITIEDAVPSNLADCSVKIDPVQDLHGQSAPYVGGANVNNLLPCPRTAQTITKGGYTATTDGNGYYTITGSSSEFVDIYFDLDKDYTTPDGSTHTLAIQNSVVNNQIGMALYYNDTFIEQGLFSEADRKIHYQGLSQVTYNQIGFRLKGNFSDPLTMKPYIYLGNPSDNVPFSPFENLCPITGHTEVDVQRDGVNWFNKSAAGIVVGKYLNSETGELVNSTNNWNTSDYIYVSGLGGESITFSGLNSIGASNFSACYYDKNNSFISGSNGKVMTLTIPSDERIAYLRFDYRQVDADDIQLELGSTATPYEPYQGKTYTISLGDTIYGGTVDFDSGVMTVDKKYIEFNGGETESWISTRDRPHSFCHTENLGIVDAWSSTDIKMISNQFIQNGEVAYYGSNYKIGYTHTATSGQLYVGIPSIDNVADFKTYLSNNHLQVVGILATPFTIQLTPQQIQLLKGQNTLTASTGQISVTVNGVSGSIGAVQEQVNDHEERIEAVESGLTNLANDTTTIQTLIALDKTTIVSGGYVQIGKAVIVTVSVTLTGNAGAVNAEISGFPITINDVIIHVRDGSDYTKVTTARISNGVLYFDTAMTAGDYVLSGTYILIN